MTAGTGAQEAGGVLQAVAKNIGADNLTTLQISGSSGFHAFPGASFNPSNDWTRFELLGYTKEIDFTARYLRERITRQFGPYARTGGALGVSPEGPSTLDVVFHRDVAWTHEGGGDGPLGREGYMDGGPIVDMRQLDILLTPHGFIKAALAPGANPTMVASRGRGQPVTYVTLMALGKYRVTATINDRNEIELIQTRIANPMFGDMPYEMRYGAYKQFGSVKFPATIHHDEGDARFNAGHNVLDVQVTDVKANVSLQFLPVPDSAKTPPVDQATIKSDKIGDGIWYIGGIRHGSVAVEFRDFVAVVEAPLNEKRAIAVINEVYRLVPNKPIRYLVNSHHHFDHSGGLRTFAAEGAAIVTHRLNREFYENVVLSPAARTLDPDRLYLLNPGVARHDLLELVDEKYVVGDDTRTLEVLPLPGLSHAATMVIAYLPRERMAVFADSGPPDIRRLGLDVGTFVSLHGGVVKPN
jgi:glyoxylase-like metal-dependent hydrolase (beta-lactamase superfamily II)